MTTPNRTNNGNVKTTGDTIQISSQITHVLGEMAAGDSTAANRLMTLVYDELRKLAAFRLAQEKPGQTLQATALVHEAYLKLVGGDQAVRWDSFNGSRP